MYAIFFYESGCSCTILYAELLGIELCTLESFTNVRKPGQVRLLLLLLSLGLGYLVAQFLLAISVFNGL